MRAAVFRKGDLVVDTIPDVVLQEGQVTWTGLVEGGRAAQFGVLGRDMGGERTGLPLTELGEQLAESHPGMGSGAPDRRQWLGWASDQGQLVAVHHLHAGPTHQVAQFIAAHTSQAAAQFATIGGQQSHGLLGAEVPLHSHHTHR